VTFTAIVEIGMGENDQIQERLRAKSIKCDQFMTPANAERRKMYFSRVHDQQQA